MSLGRKMFAGSLWATLDGWASEVANLLIFLVLVRLLGPEEFGLVALATVFTALATDLVGYSVTQILVQRRDLTPALCDAVFWLVAGLACGAAGVLVALAPMIAALFEAPALAPILRWLSLSVLLHTAAAVPLSLLTREMRFAAIAKRSLAMIGGGGAIGIGMALLGFGAWALVGQALGQATISAIMLYGATEWRPGRRGTLRDLLDIRAFAAKTAGNRAIMFLDQRAAHLVIGLFLGPAAVGYFSVAMRLVDILVRMFVVPVSQVALPAMAQVQSDAVRVRGILETGIAATSLLSAPAFVGTAVIAPQLVPLALGADWLGVIPVLQLLALRGLVWPGVLYGVSMLYAFGQPGRLLTINLVDLAANLAVLCVAAPFGVVAVAGASAARVVLVRWPLLGGAISRVSGLSLLAQARLAAPAMTAAGLMAALLVVCRGYAFTALDGAALLAALVGVGATAYALAAAALRPALVRRALLMVAELWRGGAPGQGALGNG